MEPIKLLDKIDKMINLYLQDLKNPVNNIKIYILGRHNAIENLSPGHLAVKDKYKFLSNHMEYVTSHIDKDNRRYEFISSDNVLYAPIVKVIYNDKNSFSFFVSELWKLGDDDMKDKFVLIIPPMFTDEKSDHYISYSDLVNYIIHTQIDLDMAMEDVKTEYILSYLNPINIDKVRIHADPKEYFRKVTQKEIFETINLFKFKNKNKFEKIPSYKDNIRQNYEWLLTKFSFDHHLSSMMALLTLSDISHIKKLRSKYTILHISYLAERFYQDCDCSENWDNNKLEKVVQEFDDERYYVKNLIFNRVKNASIYLGYCIESLMKYPLIPKSEWEMNIDIQGKSIEEVFNKAIQFRRIGTLFDECERCLNDRIYHYK